MLYSTLIKKLHYQTPEATSLLTAGIHSEEIDYAVNKAAFEVFLDFFEQFEQNQFSKFGITNLLINNHEVEEVMNPTEIYLYPNSKLYNTSSMFFTVNDYMVVDGQHVPIKPIPQDYYQVNFKNPMRKPDKNTSFWRIDLGGDGNLEIYKQVILDSLDYSSIKYYISYIKLPNKMTSLNMDGVLDINDEIIDTLIIPKALNTIINKYVANNKTEKNNLIK